MAKKSKARKRKQAQKRSKQVAAKPAKVAKSTVKPKTAKVTTTEEVTEERKLDEMMNEAAPREPLDQKWIIVALMVVVALLGIVLFILYQKTNDLKQSSANTGQDQLLDVQQSDTNSLQPTGATDGSSSPQTTDNPQNTPGNANQLQPQSSPSPDQLNQMQ